MHINENAKNIIEATNINIIEKIICKKVSLDTTANSPKQISPNTKSPIALVEIAEVDTFKSVFFGVNKNLSKFPVLI